jgi:hypothetical protein
VGLRNPAEDAAGNAEPGLRWLSGSANSAPSLRAALSTALTVGGLGTIATAAD